MSKRTKPATAYDYRRVIALVQALALADDVKREETIRYLADLWTSMKHRHPDYLPTDFVIRKLAQHALEKVAEEHP